MKKGVYTTLVTVAVLAGIPVTAFAAPVNKSVKLSNEQILQQETNLIQQYDKAHHVILPTQTGNMASSNLSSSSLSSNSKRLTNHVSQTEKELANPSFQESLTKKWLSTHSNSNASLSASLASPGGSVIPVGAINIVTTYQAGTTFYADSPDLSAFNYSDALTIAEDIGSFFLSTVGNVVMDVVNYYNKSVGTSNPMSAQLEHTFRYGFQDAYVWSGGTWVLALTLEDREWYRHEIAAYYNPTINNTELEAANFVQPNYGPVHVDYPLYWNNQSMIDQIAIQNYQRGIRQTYSWN